MLLQIWGYKSNANGYKHQTKRPAVNAYCSGHQSSTIPIQRAKHVHLKAQLLILHKQLPEVIMLRIDLFSESLNLLLILLRTQLQLPDPYF